MFQRIIKNKSEVMTMTLIGALALFLNIWRISIQGFANEYYTAGVTSMLQSWENFFFVAYDPAGFVSIDKPPLGLWLQAISAKVFGVSGFSVLLPEILGGVIAVLLVYMILKKAVNWKIAALGALFLAITPIFVVTARTNTPDMVMIPLLLWALYATITAIEKEKLRYLIVVGVIIGLAFNVKMLQAYMVVPAAFGAYVLFTNITLKKRLRNIMLSVIVMVMVSLSWAAVVDLTPKTERPYVGSTSSNSAMELIFGWNGISRITSTGNTPNGGGEKSGPPPINSENRETGLNQSTKMPPQGALGEMPQQGGGVMTPGTPGITRLFQKGLGEQVSWFLVLAISGFFLILFQNKKRKLKEVEVSEKELVDKDGEQTKSVNRLSQLSGVKQQAILWMLWLLPASMYFSFSTGLFHTYYLAMIASPIAALAALGFGVIFTSDVNKNKWIVPIGLIAIAGNSFFQSLYHSYYGDWEGWLVVFVPLMTLTGVIGYSVAKKLKRQTTVKKISIGIILVGITVAPFAWSLVPMLYGEDAGLAQATPKATITTTSQYEISDNTKKLAQYLVENQGESTYLVAAQSSQDVSSIIIATGKPAMAIGGFSGSDKTMTLEQFKTLVKEGKVKYYLGSGQSRNGNDDEILTWIKANSTVVQAEVYGGTTSTQSTPQQGPRGQNNTLYKIESESTV